VGAAPTSAAPTRLCLERYFGGRWTRLLSDLVCRQVGKLELFDLEGNGYYHFVARSTGKCLDVPGASTADGVQLQQYTCSGTAAQSFKMN
jgi:hypothetical protein